MYCSSSGASPADEGVGDGDALRFPRTAAAEISFGLPAIRCAANGTPNYSEWAARAKTLSERHGLIYIKASTSERGSGLVGLFLRNNGCAAMKHWDQWAAIAYAVVADDLLDVEFPGFTNPGMAEYSWTPGRLSREAFVVMQFYDEAVEADGVVDLA